MMYGMDSSHCTVVESVCPLRYRWRVDTICPQQLHCKISFRAVSVTLDAWPLRTWDSEVQGSHALTAYSA